MQRSPQRTCPATHETWQVPAEQSCPDAHAVPALPPMQSPDAPQFVGLVCGSTHMLPQATWPATQLTTHAPFEHV